MNRDSGLWYSGEYASFSVASETDKYRLSVSGFSGDVDDALAAHVNPYKIADGMQFTTPDQDNDPASAVNCGTAGHGSGWWHNRCTRSLLNYDTNAYWNADTDDIITDIQFARMLLKLD